MGHLSWRMEENSATISLILVSLFISYLMYSSSNCCKAAKNISAEKEMLSPLSTLIRKLHPGLGQGGPRSIDPRLVQDYSGAGPKLVYSIGAGVGSRLVQGLYSQAWLGLIQDWSKVGLGLVWVSPHLIVQGWLELVWNWSKVGPGLVQGWFRVSAVLIVQGWLELVEIGGLRLVQGLSGVGSGLIQGLQSKVGY